MDHSKGGDAHGNGEAERQAHGSEGAGSKAEPELREPRLGARRTHLPEEPPESGLPVVKRPDEGPGPAPLPSREPHDEPRRPSVLDGLRQSRTTVLEVGQVARRLSRVALGTGDTRHVVRQLVIAFALSLALVLTATLVFAGGPPELVLGILAATIVTALGVFGALRGVSKLAQYFGARSLPGSPWLWVGAVVLVAAATTAAFSVSAWQVTKVAIARHLPAPPKSKLSGATPATARSERADARMKRGKHIGLENGVLYAPPKFSSADGQFDLLLHYHGNVELVEQSVAEANLNALVAIVNVGDGAEKYSKALQNPFTFDRNLATIESRAQKQLGLQNAQIRRIALEAWSAGFASVNQILSSRSRLDRVDAVILLDAPHGKFAPFREPEVYLPSLNHYLTFARRALRGQKLMVITHSAIQTEGYPSTTRTTDALLQELALERRSVSPETASPPPVQIPVAKRAFPDGERNWLQVVSVVKDHDFYLFGCTGNGKGDHIAHLAQMSVTALPLLGQRWK